MSKELVLDPTEAEELRIALLELAEVEEEMKRRRRERGIDYFIPNRPQLLALRSEAKVVAYVGGNRAGKTTVGAVFATSILSQTAPRCECHGDWFSQKKKIGHATRGVIVTTEFSKVEQVIEPKLMAFLPKDWIGTMRRTPQGYLRRMNGKDGSTVDILTNEMDQMAFEGAAWDWGWIDEPTSKHRYHAILRGLVDSDGPLMLTFTPLVEPWMKDDLVDSADGKSIEVVQADSYENVEDIHSNPILTKEAIRTFEMALPEDERATRIHGKFFHLRGLVYTEFSRSMHVRDWEYGASAKYGTEPVIGVLDPHDRLPHHMIWAFVDRNDWVYVDRELVFSGTVQELKKKILLTEQRAGYRMVKRLIDPNFGLKPLITTGRTVIQELSCKPFGVSFGEANDDRTAGHLKVKDYLHWNKEIPVSLTNSPRLFFHQSRCPVTIRSIQNYQFDEWKGKTQEVRDPKEKERPKDTHGADCVRYLLMGNLMFDRLHSPAAHSRELAGSPY